MTDGNQISSTFTRIRLDLCYSHFLADMPKTLDEALGADPPCYPRACAIQTCLQKSNYNESNCAHLIDALYECCAELYKREGPGAKSTCCPKESLLTLKMKQRKEKGPRGAEVHETRRK